jgi:hypothetical protein
MHRKVPAQKPSAAPTSSAGRSLSTIDLARFLNSPQDTAHELQVRHDRFFAIKDEQIVILA